MAHVRGINHVAVVTADLDRLTSFYDNVFGAQLVGVEETPYGRLGIVRLGEGTALNLFEVPASEHVEGRPEMLERGHLDHLGIDVTDEAAFRLLRERLMAGGHSTGEITDFGPVLSVGFTDPDGMRCEINLVTDPSLAGCHEPRPFALRDRRSLDAAGPEAPSGGEGPGSWSQPLTSQA